MKKLLLHIQYFLVSIGDRIFSGKLTRIKLLIGIALLSLINSFQSCRGQRTCYVVAMDPVDQELSDTTNTNTPVKNEAETNE